ncbi:MAG: EAL domain-containing protein [Guyparkeria sp.]|uniref:EAL domain-containing protein n=1 Tax=Guyparkeria sp. TaxID=2035736 RepID=UPI00397A282F
MQTVPNSLARPAVMLVDDDSCFREELVEFLAPRVGRLVATGDRHHARRWLTRESFDLLLLDLKLKDGDSLDLIRDAFGETERKPAIVLISGLDRELLESAYRVANSLGEGGVIAEMRKPLDLDRLERVIEIEPWKQMEERPVPPAMLDPEEVRIGLGKGAVYPFLQPQYDLRDGSLVGFEALARWFRQSEGDYLSPAAFHAYLNGGEFAWPFFQQMLARSAEAFAKLEEKRRPDHLAVNAAAVIFGDERLERAIEDVAERQGLAPSTFTLELTENFSSLDETELLGIVRARVSGFGVSLDDFGKGAANLDCLVRLPLTEVKLDRWFLQNASDDKGGQFIRSIADICLQRGIRVVIEGIETASHLQLATELGFHVGQGYLLGRPVPADEIEAIPANLDIHALSSEQGPDLPRLGDDIRVPARGNWAN